MKTEIISQNANDTEDCGKALAARLEAAGITKAFIAMEGEMGVGKTAFVRGFASHFGISSVKSPTYTVMNEYSGRTVIRHFDLYRIKDEDDLYTVGYDDAIEEEGFCIAEWSENVPQALPGERINVRISRLSFGEDADDAMANSRMIEINDPIGGQEVN